MKTVGIVTIVKVNNYGAELQAFALQRKLCLMGYRAEVIDYLFYKHRDFVREKVSRPFYHYPFGKRVKEFLLPQWEKLRCSVYAGHARKRRERFRLFHERFTDFSAVTYTSYSRLYAAPPQYDVYCVGSDQVWNPNCYTSLNPYFLTFSPAGRRRISYASSFGVEALPEDAEAHYREGLSGLDAVSVRERTGVRIVEKLTGKRAQLVVDPTLLLDRNEWNRVANVSRVPDGAYILLYVLKDSRYITRLAEALAAKNGWSIVRICKNAYRQDAAGGRIHDILDAGPDEFVGLFSKARLVLTNSFHGTVFSLLFQKDFYTILKAGKDNNSRQTDLLSAVGLDRRGVYEGAFAPQPSVDYAAVQQRIDSMREASERFLYNAIENG